MIYSYSLIILRPKVNTILILFASAPKQYGPTKDAKML